MLPRIGLSCERMWSIMYDLMVIGGGPGGYHAAIYGAQQGLKTALIEKNRLGGVCLQEGCIPTKSLVHSAEVLRTCREASTFGIDVGSCTVNWDKVQLRKQSVVKQLTKGLEQLVPAQGVEVIKGEALLKDVSGPAKEVQVKLSDGGQSAANIIIAAGSVPAVPPIPGIDLPGVIGSREALEIPTVPERLLVVGGGVIGLEFACIFSAFGSQVTVVEFLPRLLASMDGEIAKRMEAELKRSRIKIHTASRVTEINRLPEGSLSAVIARGESREAIDADNILLATGRRPNVEGLGITQTGIEVSGKGIKVNNRLETSQPGVYAIGDVTGNYLLAHVASAQGMAAVDNILGQTREMDYSAVPSVVFTHPEAAGVGLTEEEAKAKGIPYKATKFMLGSNSRALTMGANRGMVKLITAVPDHRIIGAHILGPNAGELIHELVPAINTSATAEDIAHTIHAHPTLSEAVMETAHGVLGKFIHALG